MPERHVVRPDHRVLIGVDEDERGVGPGLAHGATDEDGLPVGLLVPAERVATGRGGADRVDLEVVALPGGIGRTDQIDRVVPDPDPVDRD